MPERLLSRTISALKEEQSKLCHSALSKVPSDKDLKFYFGTQVGMNHGLQRALDVIDKIIAEDAADSE